MTRLTFAADRVIGATTGPGSWTTEYERIYLMSAARLRGESVGARPGDGTTRSMLTRTR